MVSLTKCNQYLFGNLHNYVLFLKWLHSGKCCNGTFIDFLPYEARVACKYVQTYIFGYLEGNAQKTLKKVNCLTHAVDPKSHVIRYDEKRDHFAQNLDFAAFAAPC